MRHCIFILPILFNLCCIGLFHNNDFKIPKPDYFELYFNGRIVKVSDGQMYDNLSNILNEFNRIVSHRRYSTFTEETIDKTPNYLRLVYNSMQDNEYHFNDELVNINKKSFQLGPASKTKRMQYKTIIVPLNLSTPYDAIIFINNDGSEQNVISMNPFISVKVLELMNESK